MYPGSTATAVKKYTFFGQQLLSYLDLVWTGITVKICIFLTSTPALASTSSTVVVVQSGQSEDCPSNCMGYLYN